MNAFHFRKRLGSKGITFLEMLIVVAAILVVVGAVLPWISSFTGVTKNVKLEQDVKSLNSAVKAYLTFGGRIEEDDVAATVIQKLKTRATVEEANEVAGLSGQFIDPRITFVMQTDSEAETDMPRVYWEGESTRFLVATSGAIGIKRFEFSNGEIDIEGVEEERETLMGYSSERISWVWDFQDRPKEAKTNPTTVSTVEGGEFTPPPVVAATGAEPFTPTIPLNRRLAEPQFSIPAGLFPITKFDLSVAIDNPNPAGTSRILYTVDGGDWNEYTGGTVAVSAPTSLRARAIPLDPHSRANKSYWILSRTARADYDGIHKSGTLEPPMIALSAPQFITGPVESVTVTLTNPNPSEISRLDYRINGSSWQTYSGPFPISQAFFPEGISVTVETYAHSTSVYWVESSVVSETIIPSPPGDAPFAMFCSDRNPLKDYGVAIIDGGKYTSTSSDSGVDGNVAIGPGGTWDLSNGSITGEFRTHPGTSGTGSGADNQFGQGGDPVVAVATDLSSIRQEALDIASAAAEFPATETYGSVSGDTTLTASDPNGLTVFNVDEVVLNGGAILTISGGENDFVILNISDRVKMTGGSTWRVTGGLKVSQVIFNMAPGADFDGSGGSGEITGAVILAPHAESDVKITGSSIIRGAVVCGGEFTTTGGAQIFSAACGGSG